MKHRDSATFITPACVTLVMLPACVMLVHGFSDPPHDSFFFFFLERVQTGMTRHLILFFCEIVSAVQQDLAS